MRLYTSNYNDFKLNPEKKLVVIKNGFLWFETLFSRLWAVTSALSLRNHVITGTLFIFDASSTTQRVTRLGNFLMFGFLENGLRSWTLGRKYYGLVSIVSGAGIDDVATRFLGSDSKKAAAV